MGDCNYYLGNFDKALEIYFKCLEDKDLDQYMKICIYYQIGRSKGRMSEYNDAISYLRKSIYYNDTWDNLKFSAISYLAMTYRESGDNYNARKILKTNIEKYLNCKELTPTDCWNKHCTDINLSDLYYELSFSYSNVDDQEKYTIIAAAWGNKDAQEFLQKFDISYKTKPVRYYY